MAKLQFAMTVTMTERLTEIELINSDGERYFGSIGVSPSSEDMPMEWTPMSSIHNVIRTIDAGRH